MMEPASTVSREYGVLNHCEEVVYPPGEEKPVPDLNGNGLCEDINGNGSLDFDDVVALRELSLIHI